MRLVRRRLRCSLAELNSRLAGLRALAFIALAVAAPCLPVGAQTPAPRPPVKVVTPKVPLHAEVFVNTNKLGQVSHVVSIKPSADKGFNTQAFGNASQAYIRKPSGEAIAGLYRLSYDYDPKTQKVRRSVDLVKTGGVDPNAPGIVTLRQHSLDEAQKQHAQEQAQAQPQAQPSVKLPDFDKIIAPTPSH